MEHTKPFIGQPSYLIYSLPFHFCIASPTQHLLYLPSTTTPPFHNATAAPLHCLNVCPTKHGYSPMNVNHARGKGYCGGLHAANRSRGGVVQHNSIEISVRLGGISVWSEMTKVDVDTSLK